LKRAALLVAAVLLAGCAVLEPGRVSAPEPPPAPSALSTAEHLLVHFARLRALDDAGLAAEIASQRERTRREGSELARLKLALALSIANPADDAEILALVEALSSPGAGRETGVQAMASFLQRFVSERRKLRENAAAAGSRAREDRRALETQRSRAEALQERVAQLQQKLEALTTLEKSLADRQTQER